MMNPAHLSLSGRTVLVTGASSGLGARFATVLASGGANVVLAARRIGKLRQLCSDIERAGGRALAVEMDVRDEACTRRAYDAAEKTFGLVDTIVANAGMNVGGSVLDVESTELDTLFAVNVRGVFLTIREGARRLFAAPSDRKDGRVIIISSIAATAIEPGLALYSASKAAVLQMGRVMAREWVNRGINVNVLCPGYIETELNSDWFKSEGGKRQIQRWPRKRLMDIGSLDSMLLYLASDASSHVTGSVFAVDDGQTL
jgi:NAD(P)-dependent dehydrogenase (short-subunit alcohol dehydrogenase family)